LPGNPPSERDGPRYLPESSPYEHGIPPYFAGRPGFEGGIQKLYFYCRLYSLLKNPETHDKFQDFRVGGKLLFICQQQIFENNLHYQYQN
jgi:hypothetical protein